MRIRDWSSDVCSSDLVRLTRKSGDQAVPVMRGRSVEADGEQLKFPPRPFQSRVHNPGAIAVQVEKPPGQHHPRENIDRQHPTRQREPSPPTTTDKRPGETAWGRTGKNRGGEGNRKKNNER